MIKKAKILKHTTFGNFVLLYTIYDKNFFEARHLHMQRDLLIFHINTLKHSFYILYLYYCMKVESSDQNTTKLKV